MLILNDLLEIATVEFCDPYILTSVYSMINHLLENDTIEFD